MIIGKRKDWGNKEGKLIVRKEEEVMMSEINEEEGDIVIYSVYNSGGWKGIEGKLKNLTEGKEIENIVIEGDFNIRIGKLGGMDTGRYS